jgi:hypothetical protein
MDALLLASWIARESVKAEMAAAGPDRFDRDLGRPESSPSGDVRASLLARRRAGAARLLHRLADAIGPVPVRPVAG